MDSQSENINIPKTSATAYQTLAEGQSLVAGDRFLESCYWEKASEFYYQHGYQDHYQDIANALQQAIKKGYPSAHLYYKLGCLYLRKKNFMDARAAFETALKEEPQYKDVIEAEQLLGGMVNHPQAK